MLISKYKFTGKTKELYCFTLKQIKAAKDFGSVKKGQVGGWIEGEYNLSHYDDAWVNVDACVFGGGWVSGNARVDGHSQVYGHSHVYGESCIFGNAKIFGGAKIYDCAWVDENTSVYGNAEICGYTVVFGSKRITEGVHCTMRKARKAGAVYNKLARNTNLNQKEMVNIMSINWDEVAKERRKNTAEERAAVVSADLEKWEILVRHIELHPKFIPIQIIDAFVFSSCQYILVPKKEKKELKVCWIINGVTVYISEPVTANIQKVRWIEYPEGSKLLTKEKLHEVNEKLMLCREHLLNTRHPCNNDSAIDLVSKTLEILK